MQTILGLPHSSTSYNTSPSSPCCAPQPSQKHQDRRRLVHGVSRQPLSKPLKLQGVTLCRIIRVFKVSELLKMIEGSNSVKN